MVNTINESKFSEYLTTYMHPKIYFKLYGHGILTKRKKKQIFSKLQRSNIGLSHNYYNRATVVVLLGVFYRLQHFIKQM